MLHDVTSNVMLQAQAILSVQVPVVHVLTLTFQQVRMIN